MQTGPPTRAQLSLLRGPPPPRLIGLLAAALLTWPPGPFAAAARAQEAVAPERNVAILAAGDVAPLLKRFEAALIPAAVVSHEDLFAEKRLFLYEALVVSPAGTLSKSDYEVLKLFVRKGGLFIPLLTGGTAMDMDGNRRVTLPPDLIVSSQGGVFYELTGGTRVGGTYQLREFEILRECPITRGFSIGERIETDLSGLSVLWQAEGTVLCCGGAAVFRGDTARTREGSVIQVRKHGRGAGIWVTAAIHMSQEEWAGRLWRNVFSKETYAWCRQLP